MSTANAVPETWTLTGDDARETLKSTGPMHLIRDAFKRLRSADGFSHARSIAFLLALVFIEGVIALVGLASVLGTGGLSEGIVRALQTAVPGPAGRVLTDAVAQAHRAGTSSRYVALWFGLAAAIVTGTTLYGPVRTRHEPDLRDREGPADAAQVRERVPPAVLGRRARRRRVRVRRPGPRHRHVLQQRRVGHGMERRPLAHRPAVHHGRDGADPANVPRAGISRVGRGSRWAPCSRSPCG